MMSWIVGTLESSEIADRVRPLDGSQTETVSPFQSQIDMSTTGIYAISGCAVPPKRLGDHGYFGRSIDIDRRFDQHESALKRNKHHNQYLQNCFNLYGGPNYFLWYVVEECDAATLSEREIHHIEEGDTYNNPKAFNLTPGGDDGVRLAAAKNFVSKDLQNGSYFYGSNLAQFCRDHPIYD